MTDSTMTLDTLVVPASPDGFQKVFLGEECWYSFKLSKRALNELKYICVYQTRPVSAITHYAEIDRIEPFQDKKYIAYFKAGTIKEIGPIRYEHSALTAIQSPRYFNFQKVVEASTLRDLVG